jgi:hypothetical protein
LPLASSETHPAVAETELKNESPSGFNDSLLKVAEQEGMNFQNCLQVIACQYCEEHTPALPSLKKEG